MAADAAIAPSPAFTASVALVDAAATTTPVGAATAATSAAPAAAATTTATTPTLTTHARVGEEHTGPPSTPGRRCGGGGGVGRGAQLQLTVGSLPQVVLGRTEHTGKLHRHKRKSRRRRPFLPQRRGWGSASVK